MNFWLNLFGKVFSNHLVKILSLTLCIVILISIIPLNTIKVPALVNSSRNTNITSKNSVDVQYKLQTQNLNSYNPLVIVTGSNKTNIVFEHKIKGGDYYSSNYYLTYALDNSSWEELLRDSDLIYKQEFINYFHYNVSPDVEAVMYNPDLVILPNKTFYYSFLTYLFSNGTQTYQNSLSILKYTPDGNGYNLSKIYSINFSSLLPKSTSLSFKIIISNQILYIVETQYKYLSYQVSPTSWSTGENFFLSSGSILLFPSDSPFQYGYESNYTFFGYNTSTWFKIKLLSHSLSVVSITNFSSNIPQISPQSFLDTNFKLLPDLQEATNQVFYIISNYNYQINVWKINDTKASLVTTKDFNGICCSDTGFFVVKNNSEWVLYLTTLAYNGLTNVLLANQTEISSITYDEINGWGTLETITHSEVITDDVSFDCGGACYTPVSSSTVTVTSTQKTITSPLPIFDIVIAFFTLILLKKNKFHKNR